MKNTPCEKVKVLFDKKTDGVISERENELLDRHLKHCESCRREYEKLEAVREAMRSLAVDVPSQLHEGVMAAIQKETKRGIFGARWIRSLAVASVAAVLCVTVIHSPLLDGFFRAKSEMDMSEDASPSENYSAEMPDKADGKADENETLGGIAEDVNNSFSQDITITVQKSYTVAETDLLLLIINEKQAILCRDIGGDETAEMLLDFTYTNAENVIVIETDGEKQSLLIDGDRLIPQDGTLINPFLTE